LGVLYHLPVPSSVPNFTLLELDNSWLTDMAIGDMWPRVAPF